MKKIIDVVATSFFYDYTEAQMDQVKKVVSDFGYQARIPKGTMEKNADILCANTDEVRVKLFIEAALSTDSDVIWGLRGGYGAARLIPYLEKQNFPYAKTLIGYSDLTALGLYFTQKYNWRFVHAKTLGQFATQNIDQIERDAIGAILSGEAKQISYKIEAKNNPRSVSGKIVGGNLCLIQTSLGTSWEIKTDGNILLLEEAGERGYRIDRMLEHLRQAGKFRDIKAIVIGDIECTPEPDGTAKRCVSVVDRFIKSLDVPVFASNNFGHGKNNYPLLINETVTITCTDSGCALSFTSHPLSEATDL